MELLMIFINIIVPIFVIVAIGALMHRTFHLDLNTLAKLNIYYLVPGLIFVRLYETEFTWQLFLDVFLFFIFLTVFLYFVSSFFSRLFHFNKSMRISFSHSALFYNSGNYGVPVNDLVFRQDPYAMSIQVIVLTFQNLLVYSYGVFTLQAASLGKLKAFITYLKLPITYAMLTAIILNVFNIKLPSFLYTPTSYIADALIGIALLTLGAQVVQLKFSKNLFTVYLSVFVRLILSPALAYVAILILQVDGVAAQAMFISSAMPSSVNSAIIAQEYKNEPEFAAQTVLASTVFSMVTVTVVIYLSKVLF
ncbi:AEC family transporter [Halalkalibacter nanhaiisediminis]|uniref:Permease n=1 Tax=Halalkalibacter nanhaiisediminis TaxID=688079 RepID=A0A562QDG0_9BACI|nr:AEC family transporter [Halalkalibacter nanhaiisediminis]TWI54739.1 hypothetical protein IQ10_02964 [Halalkalibacter nanhaiisediminis]